jgi:acetyl esterase/lipase
MSLIIEPLAKPLEMPPGFLMLRMPLPARIANWFKLWMFKSLVATISPINRLIHPPPRSTRPTLTKYYPVRPHLKVRVHIPHSFKPADDEVVKENLPLYICLHGGAFALGSPVDDDPFNSLFANQHHIIVISMNYSKAPGHPFPHAVHDVACIVSSILSDETLPIDTERVVMGGFSAGANIALAASQLPSLRGRIKGALPWYPVTDWTTLVHEKIHTRPYKVEKPWNRDFLEGTMMLFNWGYVSPGQSFEDPLLSVIKAKKEDLPEWIFIIAAEYDILADEAGRMIRGLAGVEEAEVDKWAWERGTYRWRLVKDALHAFTHIKLDKPEEEALRKKNLEAAIQEAGEWLFKGPFA